MHSPASMGLSLRLRGGGPSLPSLPPSVLNARVPPCAAHVWSPGAWYLGGRGRRLAKRRRRALRKQRNARAAQVVACASRFLLDDDLPGVGRVPGGRVIQQHKWWLIDALMRRRQRVRAAREPATEWLLGCAWPRWQPGKRRAVCAGHGAGRWWCGSWWECPVLCGCPPFYIFSKTTVRKSVRFAPCPVFFDFVPADSPHAQ